MIIGICGLIGSGKDTIANYLTEKYNFKKDSFATSLKDACAVMFDWPRDMLEGNTMESRKWREEVDEWWSEKLGIPNLTPRLALQLIGTNALRDGFSGSIWFSTLENRIRKNPTQNVVISDVRFPNEIEFIKKTGGIMVRVMRGELPVWYSTAILANSGDKTAKGVMSTTYNNAHYSEWAWAGEEFAYSINNNGSISELKHTLDCIIGQIK